MSDSLLRNNGSLTHANESIQILLRSATEQLAVVSETAILDAEVLLCHCLNKNRSFLRTWPEHQPNVEQIACYRTLIKQRLQGTPVAYLTGQREFWSRSFKVGPEVLIPRPDTELLIELSLNLLPTDKPCKIIDLGTGSGILAITLAAERPLATVIATDLSLAALNTAKHNAERLNTVNVRFLQSHWFDGVADQDFDLVISNPPYIAKHDPHLQHGDVRFEPESALVSDENGLKDIRLIAEQARRHLKNNGHLLVEHGYNQQAEAQALFKTLNYRQVDTHVDLSGNPRVTSGIWNPPMITDEICLPRKLTNQLLHLAQISPDAEVCGLIGADASGMPVSCYPIANSADTPQNRFLLDPSQQISAMKQMRDKGETLFAIYHSHPAAPALPSAADIEQASYPEALHLIISLNTKGVLELRAFSIKDKTVRELPLNLIEA